MKSISTRTLLLEFGLLITGALLLTAAGALLLGGGTSAVKRGRGERRRLPIPGQVGYERHSHTATSSAR